MRTYQGVILGVACLVSAGNANATVLTFDDFTTTSTFEELPGTNYGGFEWTNIGIYNAKLMSLAKSGYKNGLASGDYLAFNFGISTDSSVGEITKNEAFDFDGAYFVGAWNNGLNITVSGYNGSTLLYTNTIVVDTTKSTWFEADYQGITTLKFASSGGIAAGYTGGKGFQFGMDNFTYHVDAVNPVPDPGNPVPEPATILLFGTGLMGLAGMRKRQQEKGYTVK